MTIQWGYDALVLTWVKGILGVRQQEVFFFEKKNQKTFASAIAAPQAAQHTEFAKVFCFFSSEKKNLLTLACPFFECPYKIH